MRGMMMRRVMQEASTLEFRGGALRRDMLYGRSRAADHKVPLSVS